MQNSAIVAARGLIMLGCLVAVPVVAVVWNDFPADWQTLRSRAIELLDRPWRKPELAVTASVPRATFPLADAPPADAALVARGDWAAPASWSVAPPPIETSPTAAGPMAAGPSRTVPATVAPRGPSRRSMSAWSREVHAERSVAVPGQRLEAPQSRFEPAGPLVPIPSGAPSPRGADGVSPATHVESGQLPMRNARGETAANPTIETQLARLRQLGASYYLLETWGGDGRLFRFHSKMSTGPGRATRHFEATDRDPLSAIQQVVRQVEAWRFSNTP